MKAELIFNLHAKRKVDPNQLTAFAVYFVPPAGSELYEFGTKILESDVRRTGLVIKPSKWHFAIGVAADFGFHLTVADALYCANKEDLKLIGEEVRFVAQNRPNSSSTSGWRKIFQIHRGLRWWAGIVAARWRHYITRWSRGCIARRWPPITAWGLLRLTATRTRSGQTL